jgi:hypothetical protein
MKSVEEFIQDQLKRIDIDSQRQAIIDQAFEIKEQTQKIAKLFFDGPVTVSTG